MPVKDYASTEEPTLLELVNRNVYYANNGAIIENTWYVEPYNAAESVLICLIGSTSAVGRNLPTRDFRIPACYCYEVQILPSDKKQFASTGRIFKMGEKPDYQVNIINSLANFNIDFNNLPLKIVSTENKDRTAGCFIVAKYKTVSSLVLSSNDRFFDYVDYKKEIRELIHQIPYGLRLKTIQGGFFQPNTGVAPVIKEVYEHVTVKRIMVPPLNHTDLDFLNNMVNCVNEQTFNFNPAPIAGELDSQRIPTCCCKFVGYEEERQITPIFGEKDPNSIAQILWYNYTLHFDIRTLKQVGCVHASTGELIDGEAQVNWQMQLAFPGKGLKFGAGFFGLQKHMELGWYWSGYSTDFIGAFGPEALVPPYRTRSTADFYKLFTIGF